MQKLWLRHFRDAFFDDSASQIDVFFFDTAKRQMQSLRIVGKGKIYWLKEVTPLPPAAFDALIEWRLN